MFCRHLNSKKVKKHNVHCNFFFFVCTRFILIHDREKWQGWWDTACPGPPHLWKAWALHGNADVRRRNECSILVCLHQKGWDETRLSDLPCTFIITTDPLVSRCPWELCGRLRYVRKCSQKGSLQTGDATLLRSSNCVAPSERFSHDQWLKHPLERWNYF